MSNRSANNKEDAVRKKKLCIIEEQEIFRKLYESVLGMEFDIELIENKFDDSTSNLITQKIHPDLLLVSLKHIDEKAINNIFEIQNRQPKMGIVVLLVSFNRKHVDLLRRVATSNICGLALFLKRSLDMSEQLVGIIRSVLHGQVILDPLISPSLLSNDNDCPFLQQMTSREKEILALLADGYTNAAIAKTLFIDLKTVEHHINVMYSKMKSVMDFAEKHPRVQAARLYLEATGIGLESRQHSLGYKVYDKD